MTVSREQSDASPDEPLVEPERVETQTPSPENLTTDEILRITQSLTLPQPSAPEATAQPASEPDLSQTTQSAPVPPARWNILAVISMILALTASPLTVVFGYLAVGQIRRAGQRGEAVAWVAVALGWLWLVAWIVLGISLAVIWGDL
jgi:hypothetical protein